jgi:MoxR-like ATPase
MRHAEGFMTIARTDPVLAPDPGPLLAVAERAARIVLGKSRQIRLALACLVARGHLLIEDLPGVGKTTLAHALAHLLGLRYQRIQFTSDLLPADILGVSVFDRERAAFRFVPGPVFAHLILADEINRATPKTQSALLEAMEERQVTVEGETRPLPDPFFVIATQNPSHQIGTFPLPESQLDRFLMRITLGYPDRGAELSLLAGGDQRALLAEHAPLMKDAELPAMQRVTAALRVSPALLSYTLALLQRTRDSNRFQHGLSPRAGLGIIAAARGWAFLEGRDYVVPEDVQAVFPEVACHRLRLAGGGALASREDALAVLRATPLP